MTKTVHILSPAKVNLFLEVLGKRQDGYHELETIFQEVDLYDEISIYPLETSEIRISSNSPDLPLDSTNLAYQAAEIFLKKAGIPQGIHIEILKRIPISGGLGGGSSNAAAIFKALQELFTVKIAFEDLLQMARSLGADVPFFLTGGTAIGYGIGDRLKPLSSRQELFLLLVNPRFKISTAEVYQGLNLGLTSSNPSINLVKKAIEQGKAIEIASHLFNRLEDVVLERFPLLREIKEVLKSLGALGSLLSGSGSTLFAVTESHEKAIELQNKFHTFYKMSFWTAVCRSVIRKS